MDRTISCKRRSDLVLSYLSQGNERVFLIQMQYERTSTCCPLTVSFVHDEFSMAADLSVREPMDQAGSRGREVAGLGALNVEVEAGRHWHWQVHELQVNVNVVNIVNCVNDVDDIVMERCVMEIRRN